MEELDWFAAIGYQVRTKRAHVFPGVERRVEVVCPCCDEEFGMSLVAPGHRKSNCDVELTVDALEVLRPGDEALIFTGDGDFAYLIETLIERGVMVRLMSSMERDRWGRRTFSSRLAKIVEREHRGAGRLQFIQLQDWRRFIEGSSLLPG